MGDQGTTRRSLLLAGGTLAAGVGIAACGAKSGPAAAATASARAGTGVTTAARTVSGSAPDWTGLAHRLSGRLIRPGQADFGEAAELFQPRFDSVRPAAVAYVANAKDVATCIAFARSSGVPIVPRNGGHSYAGWSTVSNGLVIDVGQLGTVSASGATASIGAGARLIDVYTRLAASGRTIPAGSCPSVGVSGLTLGGGVGVTGRANGLTCDNLIGAEIVTPDGRIREVSAQQDADLFWALRGAGGGNFGVVTRLDFRTHPADDCAYGFLSWPWSRARQAVEAWQRWAPSAPDSLWANLHITASWDGNLRVQSTVNMLGGSRTELANLIDRLAERPTSVSLHSASYLTTMQVMGGVAGESGAQAHLPGVLPGHNRAGRVVRSSYGARSDFFTQPLTGAGAAAVVAAVARYRSYAPKGGDAAIAFDALGGAINRVGAGDTAFVHRNALFLAQYTADYPAGVTGGSAASQSWSWINNAWTTMRPYASGEAYQNYIDPGLHGWEQAYYGANATRLRQVKRTYDPQGLFRFPQGIPLT
ncbi:FAD-binding oxidoreductase [Streptacidiphilus melanogenes]|uniref:FAD-binding oxidoreductase n=1 Tax=Streptacidiphilus melanogenes TaxID=411235 RepID=UPI0009FBDD70|nr:FAD-binding oxidoreductase [Streptacidiphilus melanogenes]